MDNKAKIIRKDGTEYYRKKRKSNCDSYIKIRCSNNVTETLKDIANKRNINLSKLVREIIDNYINNKNQKRKSVK